MTADLVFIAYAMAGAGLSLIYSVLKTLQKNHAETALRIERLQVEISNVKSSVEGVFYQVEAIRRKGDDRN